jgi:hypothetical protein
MGLFVVRYRPAVVHQQIGWIGNICLNAVPSVQ